MIHAPLPPLRATLAEALGAVRHALHPALVDADGWRRVLRVAARMPADLTRVFYLETRLAGEARAADLIFEVDAGARHHLLELDVDDRRAPAAPDSAWRAVRRMAASWHAGESEAARAVHHLWLEFDVPPTGTGGERPVPGVFVCFGEHRPAADAREEWARHAVEVLRVLDGTRLTSALEARIRQCIAALPAGAYLPYVGVMLGRTEPAARLCFTYLPAGATLPFLEHLGWRGARKVGRYIDRLAGAQPEGPLRGAGMLHLDLTADGATRLGIEFACQRAPQLRGDLAERPMLDRLVADGLCTGERRDALLAWPGATVQRLPLRRGATVLVRRLNHVKLVFRPGEEPEAKGYLGSWSVVRTAAPQMPAQQRSPAPHPLAAEPSP